VVRTHPETGKQALYVNHGFTNRFDGMTRTESKPLLDYLVEVGSRADFTVRHSWAVGDIVMWDNRCVMHYAIHDYDDMPREMHRVTVCGERPA
jgi:taurine dioxygenase